MNNTGAAMPKKILFIIDSFSGGGAERVLSRVMTGIDRRRFQPSLLLLLRPEQAYPLPDHIAVEFQGKSPIPAPVTWICSLFAVMVSLPRIFSPARCRDTYSHLYGALCEIAATSLSLRERLRRDPPDAIVVFLLSSIVITLCTVLFFRIPIPVCCSDRIFLSRELRTLRYPKVTAFLLKLLYRRAQRYIAVSEETRRDMSDSFGVAGEKIVTIYNGVDLELLKSLAVEPLEDGEAMAPLQGMITMITSGRLMAQKGHHYLLRAFARVRQELPCRLVVLGEGELLDELRQLATELQVADQVVFAGWQANPFNRIAAADLFVLSSRYEGFPNALLEAMALGVPVVATDCQSGPAEILAGGRYGLLVPVDDADSLAGALMKLAGDKELRREMSRLATERVAGFSLERMVLAYESMLDELLQATPPLPP